MDKIWGGVRWGRNDLESISNSLKTKADMDI